MAFRADRAALAAALALSLALLGCGGATNEASAPTETTTTAPSASREDQSAAGQPAGSSKPTRRSQPPAQPGPPTSAFHTKHHHDSGGGSHQFIVKGADNSVQEFGVEAGTAEFQQAAATLHGFLDARAERNWAAACTYLSKAVKQGFAQSGSSSRPPSCAANLAALSGNVPSATLRESAVADIGSLRREGRRGFLIYRGAPKGTVYAISIAEEGGAWKVASLAGTPLN